MAALAAVRSHDHAERSGGIADTWSSFEARVGSPTPAVADSGGRGAIGGTASGDNCAGGWRFLAAGAFAARDDPARSAMHPMRAPGPEAMTSHRPGPGP